MVNDGIGEIGIVCFKQFEIFNVAQLLGDSSRGLHIRKQENPFFLDGSVILSGKEIHQHSVADVLTDFRIEQTYEQTERDRNHGTYEFNIPEKIPQFVQNDGVKKRYLGLQGGRDRIGDEDNQQQEHGIKDKLVANFP